MANPGQAAPPSFGAAARPHPLWSVAAVLLTFVFSGIFVQLLPVVAPAIIRDWALPDTALALPMAMVLVGAGVGTLLGGIFSDVIGRRVLIGTSVGALALITALSTLASQPWHLMISMVLGGTAMGCFFSSGLALVSEIATPQRRALAISLTVASIPVGLTLASLAGAIVLPAFGWKTTFLLGALFGVPTLLLFIWFVPESPSFLASKPHRRADYLYVIERLSLPASEHQGHDEAQPPLARRFLALVRAAPVATVGLLLMFLGANMFGNAVLSWVPVAFSNLGFPLSFASGALTGWTTATMLMTPGAGWLLGKFGFRIVGPVSTGITCLALILLGTFSSRETSTTLIWLMLAMGGTGTAGLVTSLYTLAAETFPPQLRGTGLGISDAVGRVGGVCGAYVGVHLLELSGIRGFFYALAAVLAVIILLMIFAHEKPSRSDS